MEDHADHALGNLEVIMETISQKSSVDVVAVGGFGGRSRQSWTCNSENLQKQSMWLEDILPSHIARTRIMEFTYSSDAGQAEDILSVDGLSRAAKTLLEGLRIERRDEEYENVPLIFVAHDLGGLIAKKTLIMAERDPVLYKTIAQNSNLAVFFGTPHRASDTSSWEDLILSIVLSVPSIPPSRHIATRVKEFSESLERLSYDFTSTHYRHCIMNVYQHITADTHMNIVIDRHSSTTGFSHETNIGRNSVHQDICKFSENDHQLRTIIEAFKSEMNTVYAGCLSTLLNISPPFNFFEGYEPGRVELQDIPQKDFDDKFDTWIKASPPLPLRNPGSGVDGAASAQALLHQLEEKSLPVAYYSFKAYDLQRRSAIGFLASIIFQILYQDASRFAAVERLIAAMNRLGAWTRAGLSSLFRSLLLANAQQQLIVVIANIQECNSSRTCLLEAIIEPGCHYHFDHDYIFPGGYRFAFFGPEPQDVKESLEKLGDKYIANATVSKTLSGIYAVTQFERIVKDHRYLLGLRSSIIETLKRCETPTQVALTLHSILGEAMTGSRSRNSVTDLLTNLPHPTINIVSSRFKMLPGWARIALGWLLRSKRPLKLDELLTAVRISKSGGNIANLLDSGDLPLDIAAGLQTVFGPLIRMERGKLLFSDEDIRNYFLRLLEQEKIESDLSEKHNNTRSSAIIAVPDDGQITRILIQYLFSIRSFRLLASASQSLEPTELPESLVKPHDESLLNLVEYAARFWPLHHRGAEESQAETATTLNILLKPNMVIVLSQLASDPAAPALPQSIPVDEPVLLAALLGLINITKKIGDSVEGAKREAAIALASWGGHADVVDVLLGNSHQASSVDLSEALRHASVRGHDTIVSRLLEHIASQRRKLEADTMAQLVCHAAQLGYTTQMSLFAAHGAPTNLPHDGMTPLQYAASNGNDSVVKFLLADRSRGIDVNASGSQPGREPILLATSGGNRIIVQRLLKSPAKVDIRVHEIDGSNALHIAARQGYSDIAQLLLEHHHKSSAEATGSSSTPRFIDIQNSSGESALILACRSQHTEVANLLLDEDADVSLVSNDGHTALYHAIHPGNGQLAKTILAANKSLDLISDLKDVFYRAAMLGFTPIVSHCLEAIQKDKDAVDEFREYTLGDSQRTALHASAEGGHQEIVSLLLAADFFTDSADCSNDTPLSLASKAGNVEIVKILLEHGAAASHNQSGILRAVIDQANSQGKLAEITNTLLEHGADPNAKGDNYGGTVLHNAARRGIVDIVKVLLEHGSDYRETDIYLRTPLHRTASLRSRASVEVAKVLIEAGADPRQGDDEGWTVMHTASRLGNMYMLQFLWECDHTVLMVRTNDDATILHLGYDEPDSLKWLLGHDVDVDATDKYGRTTLMSAAEDDSQEECVQILLDHSADPSVRDVDGRTALHHATSSAASCCARKLLRKDPTILGYKDEDSHSALFLAICDDDCLGVAEMLLDEFYTRASEDELAGLNDQDGDGNTPLLLAVENKLEGIVDRLMKLHVDTSLRNKKQKDALLLATEKRHMGIIRILLDPDISNRADINAGGGDIPTALHTAAQAGAQVYVEELIKLKADVDHEGGEYNTALTAAAAGGFDEIVNLLLKEGASPSNQGGIFANALSAALFSETYDIVPDLIGTDRNINSQDCQGRSSLHIAALRGSLDMIKMLRGAGGDLNRKDKQGRTLLHYAAVSGASNLAFTELLHYDDRIQRDLDAADVHGWTPLHWACRSNTNLGIVEVLLREEVNIRAATLNGWTAENIAMFHQAYDILHLVLQKLEPKFSTSEPAPKRWKVGTTNWGICDGCELTPIYGVQWHCKDCEDFDFCFKCYWSAEKTHPGHEFEKIGVDNELEPELEEDSARESDVYSESSAVTSDQ